MISGGLFLIGLLLALTLAAATFVAFRRTGVGAVAFVVWTLIGLAIGVASLFPELVSRLASLFTVEARGLLVLTLGLALVYLVAFGNYVSSRRSEKRIELLLQEISLLRYALGDGDKETDNARRGDNRGSE